MPAPAEFHLHVPRFGVWRAGLAGLLLAAAGAGVAWALQTERGPGSASSALVALAVTAGAWGALSLWTPAPFELRWDTRQWHLARPAHPTCAGTLQVAVDAGAWMLLRFVPDGSPPGRACWLPVQRRGLESRWHGFRATVFSARLAVEPGHAPS